MALNIPLSSKTPAHNHTQTHVQRICSEAKHWSKGANRPNQGKTYVWTHIYHDFMLHSHLHIRDNEWNTIQSSSLPPLFADDVLVYDGTIRRSISLTKNRMAWITLIIPATNKRDNIWGKNGGKRIRCMCMYLWANSIPVFFSVPRLHVFSLRFVRKKMALLFTSYPFAPSLIRNLWCGYLILAVVSNQINDIHLIKKRLNRKLIWKHFHMDSQFISLNDYESLCIFL